MDITVVQALLIFVVAFIMGIDQFSFLESLYQPVVLGPIMGAILGNFELGIVVGGAYQLVQIGSMPIGGAQPPNAIMGVVGGGHPQAEHIRGIRDFYGIGTDS